MTPQRVAESLEELLTDLDRQAAEAAARIGTPPTTRSERSRNFGVLEQLDQERAGSWSGEQRSWFLFDPNGEAVAWAGRGLVHEVDGAAVPQQGRVQISSFSAATFISVAPLDTSRRPWRVAVGVSLESELLPVPEESPGQWALVSDDFDPEPGTVIAEAANVRVALREADAQLATTAATERRPWAALLMAAALAFAAYERLRSGAGELGVLALAAVAGTLATLLLDLQPWLLAPFLAGLALILWSRARVPLRLSAWTVDVAVGMAVALILLLAVYFLQSRVGATDLGSSLAGGAERVALRISMFALVVGLLSAVGGASEAKSGRSAALSAAALLTAAAAHGWVVIGLVAFVAGSILAVSWSRRGGWREGALGVVSGLVLAALISAIAWELGFHRASEARLEQLVAEDLAAPTEEEIEELRAEVRSHFEEMALEDLTVADPGGLDSQDLAFAVWRRSPLERRGRHSSVTVGVPAAPLSSFSYRLASAESVLEDRDGSRRGPQWPGWEAATVSGLGTLTLGGGPWAAVEYEVFLRPGFRSGGSLLPGLAEGLLERQAPGLPLELGDVPPEVLLGIYGPDGEVLVPPWRGAPDAAAGFDADRVPIPGGLARTFVGSDSGVTRVAYLPLPSPISAVERIATHAASPLVVLLGLYGLWFAVTLGEPRRREVLSSGWRSFSKRLVVLYSLLLLVPIVLVNLLVLGVFADRLEREQRLAGEAALESAQRILSDYVFSLDPGFGIDTAVGDDVLLWLSGVVHHDVNLYWGSRLSASSKRELFASGLLPRRIPGDIFARVALEGSSLASRRTRAGGAVYQEFYAPLEAPGLESEDAGLFVSTPLLAQEVATAEEMGTIRRRILLAGGGVALLLVLLGQRVGRSFTRPLLQIIEGTEAIAAGAPSIAVDTTDSEFLTLVTAIDEMASRIAAARTDLLREKEVVDRMIDNITSGVVSVDRQGRVLLLNRTAHELLGIRIGDPLVESLAKDESLEAVADFVKDVGSSPGQRTVSLAGGDGEETEWTLVWVPLAGSGEPEALFVIEDVTEVLRGQRLEAWAEMARMIAHEVKNPLTPIRLSTEHLREVHRSRRGDLDSALERCTSNILEQVEELQQIASDFSAYSRIPTIDPKPGDLAELIEGLVEGYRAGGPGVTFARVDGPWQAEFDAKLLSRAVRNVLENAIRATRDSGSVEVTVTGQGGRLEVEVADSGMGVAADHLPRLFEPYFSTEDSGTGLGLPIARRIIEEHGGSIAARNRSPRGLAVTMLLPRAAAEA